MTSSTGSTWWNTNTGDITKADAIKALSIALVATVLAGADTPTSFRLSPQQAVMNAAESSNGVTGVFEFAVRGVGDDHRGFYSNSERDYRDPRNLTVVLRLWINQQLAQRFNAMPAAHLLGRTIAVRGTARKTRMDFLDNGRPTGKYYYQTHLILERASDLTVEDEKPRA